MYGYQNWHNQVSQMHIRMRSNVHIRQRYQISIFYRCWWFRSKYSDNRTQIQYCTFNLPERFYRLLWRQLGTIVYFRIHKYWSCSKSKWIWKLTNEWIYLNIQQWSNILKSNERDFFIEKFIQIKNKSNRWSSKVNLRSAKLTPIH